MLVCFWCEAVNRGAVLWKSIDVLSLFWSIVCDVKIGIRGLNKCNSENGVNIGP